tara:strand:- start:556 stop:768 length:213 start_codon:yes stop_codon:yes gene_type:complete
MNKVIYTSYIDVTLSFSHETTAKSKADAETYFNELDLNEVMCMLKGKDSLRTNPSLNYNIESQEVLEIVT